jgi:hypothetical protein
MGFAGVWVKGLAGLVGTETRTGQEDGYFIKWQEYQPTTELNIIPTLPELFLIPNYLW